jgi:hypothetical protein
LRLIQDGLKKSSKIIEVENEEAIRERGRNLEERYIKRRTEIKDEQGEIKESIIEIEFFESTETDYREEDERIDTNINKVRIRVDQNIRSRENLPERFQQLKEGEQRRIKTEERRIKEQGENLPIIFAGKERELETEFEEIGERRIRQVKNENIGESSELSSKLKKILDTRGLLINWDEKQNNYERNRRAWECFRNGTYKNWN